MGLLYCILFSHLKLNLLLSTHLSSVGITDVIISSGFLDCHLFFSIFCIFDWNVRLALNVLIECTCVPCVYIHWMCLCYGHCAFVLNTSGMCICSNSCLWLMLMAGAGMGCLG